MTRVSHPAIRTLLHPSDFSEASGRAFDHALKISLCNQCNFDILHIHSGSLKASEWSEFPQVRRTLEEWNLLQKGSSRSAVGDQLGVLVRKVDLSGKRPLPAIVGYVEEEEPDLIVLSTEGRRGLPRWLKPSVSEPLARRTRTATLFIPQGARGFVSRDDGAVRMHRVLIPVDRTPDPQAAIASAGAFIRSIDVRAPRIDAFYVGDPGNMPKVEPPNRLDGDFDHTVRQGNPVDEILGFANEWQSDLIVMATEGHNGFLDALRGSTTEQILRRSPCPVLAIPVAGG